MGRKFKKMKEHKSLTANTIFYMIYNVLNIVFSFVTGMYAARVLLPNDIGIVESAKNFVQYFVIFSFLGIPTYGLREISKCRKNQENLNKTYTELMIINAISTTFFGILYLIIIFMVKSYSENIAVYLILGLLIFLNYFNNSWLYEGLEKFQFISTRNLIFKFISFLVLVLFVRDKNDYIWYAIMFVVGTSGNYFYNIICAKRYVKLEFRDLNIKRHLKSIAYLVFVNLAIEIYTLVDITMLSSICEKENVAFYSYGSKIFRILITVLNTLTTVIVPKLALIYKEGNLHEYNKLITKALKIIVMVAVPFIIGIYFTSDYLITLVYGSSYITSSYVLKVLSISLIITPVGYLLGSRVMLITEHENKMIIPVTCGAIVNLILNLFLIKRYSEIGAAIASVISEIVVMCIYIILSRKYFKLENIKRFLFNIILTSIVMAIYLYIISKVKANPGWICFFQVIGAIAIYCSILIILKEPTINDVKDKLIKKIGGKSIEK